MQTFEPSNQQIEEKVKSSHINLEEKGLCASPVYELFDYFHAGVQFIQSQNILLSKETESGAFPEVLKPKGQTSVGELESSNVKRRGRVWCSVYTHHVVFEDSLNHRSEHFNHHH